MITIQDFELFRKGDKVAFKQIFKSFYKSLLFFANKYVKNIELAEDLVQEVFIKLWEKRDKIEDSVLVKAFLYVSVKNAALNHFRHQKVIEAHQQEIIQKESDFFFKNHLIEEETYRLLTESINNLPEQTRNVCTLSMRGVGNILIAEQLGITISTVKYHKKQAIGILKEQLKNHLYLLSLLAYLFDM